MKLFEINEVNKTKFYGMKMFKIISDSPLMVVEMRKVYVIRRNKKVVSVRSCSYEPTTSHHIVRQHDTKQASKQTLSAM